jgi:DNA-binding transcriptional LysR family regulator
MLQPHVLRHFAEVARSGSLRVTADQHEIAPSALSRQINQLEKFLDTKLFIRSAKGMHLTEVGKELYIYIEENNRNIDALLQRIEDIDELRHGAVRIASVEGATISFLPDLMARFSEGFPGIRFEVVVGGSNDVADRVGSGDSEIGIAFNCPSRDDLVLRTRIPQPLHLVGHRHHPAVQKSLAAFSDLSGLRLALPTRQFGIRRLIEQALRLHQVEGHIAFESDSLLLIKQIVSQTDMVTCLPEIVFEREVSNNRLSACPITDRLCSAASIDIVTPHGRALSGAARQFLGILTDAAKDKINRQPAALLPSLG